jgi:hypothetical protein
MDIDNINNGSNREKLGEVPKHAPKSKKAHG